MNTYFKERIIELRSKKISYYKISKILGEEGIKISSKTARNYYISRVPSLILTTKEQFMLMDRLLDNLVELIKTSVSTESAYIKADSIQGMHNVLFWNFENWVFKIGGLKNIKKEDFKALAHSTQSHVIRRLCIEILDNNKDIVLNNLDKSYQYICDLVQDKEDYIVSPGELRIWCKSNGIVKVRKKVS